MKKVIKRIFISMRMFQTVAWAHASNIYEVNVRQYTQEGTINAFAKHVPRLKEMGVHTLWFMPLTPIAQKNKKGSLGSYYAASDYTSINSEFGTPEDFQSLVDDAHQQGFKIIIDWVANHTGWDHIWTKEHPEYYLMDPANGDFKKASGMDDIIELDFKNEALRKAMVDAMKFWITEFDIDGFRCDLAFWVELDFWKEARTELEKIKPLFWLGEFDELERPEYGEVFDASYTWTWMHRTAEFYKKDISIETLMNVLKRYDDLGDQTMRAWFTSNHDENSWNGTEYEKYGDMAKALAVFSVTWNGIPLLYSGQEAGNKKRLAFFEKDEIEWEKNDELIEFYKTLFQLKANHPALRGGDSSIQTFRLKSNASAQVMCFLRRKVDHYVLVILNFSSENISLVISDDHIEGLEFIPVFNEESFTSEVIQLEPWQYLIFQNK